MKPLCTVLFLALVLEQADALDQPLLLTFDHVSPYDYVQIEDGYGSLDWNNFFIQNASSSWPPWPSWRFWTLVSPPNVAFNGLGEPASFSSSTGARFTLTSAHFRAIYVDSQQIRIQGFRGSDLAYDTTYTVSQAPTLIEFDYADIDRVTFAIVTVPAGIFAMDDLLISPVDADSDNDGVPDDQDRCPGTISGAVVNEYGCSIYQIVRCSGPRVGRVWRNHGQYVAAVTATANNFLAAGRITPRDRNAIVRAAARSNCGKRAGPHRPQKSKNLWMKFNSADLPPIFIR